MAAALSGPLVLLAGDTWRDKDPSQWTSDEVNQVLTNSPWAKQVTASQNSDWSQGGSRGGGYGGGGGGGGMGGGGMGGGGGGRGGGRSRGGSQNTPAPKVTIRWESAAPVHQALLKSEVADASKFADWSKDYYVVTVSGLPQWGQRQGGSDDNDQQQDPDRAKEMQERMQDHLKQSTSLKLKSRTIAPERVDTLDSAGGHTFVFLFPRTSNILADDKEVAFGTSMGRWEIKSKFTLKEMQFKDKLEL